MSKVRAVDEQDCDSVAPMQWRNLVLGEYLGTHDRTTSTQNDLRG